MEILNIEDLSFSYPDRSEKALSGVSFSVEKGDLIAVCGASGSGKTTLLRLLKPELRPRGELLGRILYNGNELRGESPAIGFVMQRPEQQIVTDKVWHELAFGAENLGLPQETIRLRVAETASFFGIEDRFDKDVSGLSGGQKQLLNLASVMVTQPDILLLDEPTAQLDPIAASDFIAAVTRLNRELSLTVIIIEHRTEEILPSANKLLALENGKLLTFGETRTAAGRLGGHPLLAKSLPAAARLFFKLGKSGACPITVREGRELIEKELPEKPVPPARSEHIHSPAAALRLKDVFFRYERGLSDVLRELSLTVYENEIFCILGGNGSGKSTALSVISGILKPYSGSVEIFGKKQKNYTNGELYRNCLALLPQDVQTVFVRDSVREELEECGAAEEELPFDLTPLLDRHPYDLSGGEQQLAALAKVLGTKPRLLLLDEPTKGLDAAAREDIALLLKKLRDGGMTIVTVTHDVEFAALCADRCALFFRGEAVSCGVPHEFFPGNSFYTTAADRMTRGICGGAITVDEAAELCLTSERSSNADDKERRST